MLMCPDVVCIIRFRFFALACLCTVEVHRVANFKDLFISVRFCNAVLTYRNFLKSEDLSIH